MKDCTKTVVAALSVSLVVNCAFAAEKLWIGEDDGLWETAANWSPSGAPGYSDIAVFDPGEGNVLHLRSQAIVTCNGMKAMSGTVCYTVTGNRMYITCNCSNEFYVAAGSTLAITNAVVTQAPGTGQLKASVLKTGAGLLALGCTSSSERFGNDYGKLNCFDVKEGTVLLDYDATTQIMCDFYVRSGALVKHPRTYGFHSSECVITIEEGGTVDLKGSNPTYMTALRGGGDIINAYAITNLKLARGPHYFTGHIYPVEGRATVDFVPQAKDASYTDAEWKQYIGSESFSEVKVCLPNSEGSPIGFIDGIGGFFIGQLQGDNTSMLTLENESGEPVAVYSDWSNPIKFRVAGKGAWINTKDSRAITGSTVDLAGLTGTLGVNGGELTLGNATDAGWPTLNPAVSFYNTDHGRFWIKPGTAGTTVNANLTGTGTYGFYGKAEYTAFNPDDAWVQFRDNCDVTVSGGHATIHGATDSYYMYFYSGAKLTLTGADTYIGGVPAAPGYLSYGIAKREAETWIYTGSQHATVTVENGARICMGSCWPKTMTIQSGGRVMWRRNADAGSATTADPYVITWDGGILEAAPYVSPYTLFLDLTDSKVRHQVGVNGMKLVTRTWDFPCTDGMRQFRFRSPIYSVPDVVDGGITRYGAGMLDLDKPLEISGTFDNQDGVLRVGKNYSDTDSGILDGTKPLTGSGDFRMGNSRFEIHQDVPSASTISLGTGGSFRFDGAATVRLRAGGSATAHTVQTGPLVREGHGALFAWFPGDGITGGFIPDTAPEADSNGRILAPVFIVNGADAVCSFAAYDDNDGLVGFEDDVQGVSGGADSDARVSAAKLTVEADAQVGSLRVDGKAGIDTTVSPVLTIADGVTLTVGDGTNPACVILNSVGGNSVGSIGGEGTLDFGNSEGVVVGGKMLGGSWNPRIDAKITGQAGVTFIDVIDCSAGNAIELGGVNTYLGDTYVNAVYVKPKNSAALSSGTVVLGNGTLAGGGLWLSKEGLVVPNDVRAAGFGPISRIPGVKTFAYGKGAIFFSASSELSGAVEAYDLLRIGAYGDGVRGVISGVISGDRIQLHAIHDDAWSEAMVVFDAANSYTGGTDVVKSTLALTDSGTAGTGEIFLDGGVLRLENRLAKTIANPVRGVGTIQLAGAGTVTLAKNEPQDGDQYDEGFTLDLAVKHATIKSAKGFKAITTSLTGPVALTVMDGDWWDFQEIPDNVSLYLPGEYHAPGAMLIFK